MIRQFEVFWISMVWLSLSCSNGGRPPQPTNAPSSAVGPGDIPVAPETRQRQRAQQHAAEPELVERFNFGENLSQAHLRSGGILVDFGTGARHKHTLGDWRSGFGGDFEKEGISYSYMTGRSARISFYAFSDDAGGGTISLRARGHGASQVRVFLNGKFLDAAAVSQKGFSHAAVDFADGIVPGLNHIELQCSARKKTAEGLTAAIAIDYVRIASEQTPSGPAAASYDTVRYRDETSGKDEIALTGGESLTYFLPVPKGARIQGHLVTRTNHQKGHLSIAVKTDNPDKALSFFREANARRKPIDIDLSHIAGEVAAITFYAERGEVRLENAGLFSPAEKKEEAPGRFAAKNLVLVLIDTLRADKIDVYNSETRVRTPYLTRLAKEAMTFKRALAPENWTKPSVASLLTGLYPETHGTKDDRDKLPRSAATIQEHLKSLGFTTAGFVANGYISDKFGFRRGFDTWTNYVREGKANRAQFVVDDAVTWLRKKTDDKPFFLYVHTIDPHVPYIPPRKYLHMYDVGPYNGPVKASGTAKLAEQIKTHKIQLNERDKMRFEALYDGEITYHDDHLVRLHEKLGDLGLLEDTLLIITADHGEEFFEHGLVGHGHSLYEELLHVPLFIRLPGAVEKHGKKSAANYREVSLADLFPTACEILGIECPEEVEGRSLVPHLKGDVRGPFPSASFSEFLSGQRAARMGRYKLILRGERTSLFDLRSDRRETRDLSNERPIALTALLDALGAHLGRFMRSTDEDKESRGPARHKPEKAIIDPETRKQLKALGYIGDD